MSVGLALLEMAEEMREWQRVENAAISQTARVMEKTENPLVRLVMELIQRDSVFHHRVQQLIIDSIEKQAVAITPADLEAVWDMIEQHLELEKKTVLYGEKAWYGLEGTVNPVQQYLLSYLLTDEKKHVKLLDDLALIKRGMYP